MFSAGATIYSPIARISPSPPCGEIQNAESPDFTFRDLFLWVARRALGPSFGKPGAG
jgi:hypothetical protein